jgi:hypothetical protein
VGRTDVLIVSNKEISTMQLLRYPNRWEITARIECDLVRIYH